MGWILETEENRLLSPFQQPPPHLISSSQSSRVLNLSNSVSPNVLLIIIIVFIIFFISGLLHLLVRFLLKPPNRDSDELDNGSALQGQLQQLFHLHDAGVDQSFIDTLPVFKYKAIIGVKDPFDCAVCLCEFEAEDKLRLLPKCSHAFHTECIDTWLLSHSTCPLCRAILLPDFSPAGDCSPVVLVLQSERESSREIVQDFNGSGSTNSFARVNSHLSADNFRVKSDEIQENEDENQKLFEGFGEKVVPVKLGKFRNVDGGSEGSTSQNNVDERRCFSVGSFAYVMDENTLLQVPIRSDPAKKESSKKSKPGHRLAMSECGCDSRSKFNGFDSFKILQNSINGNNRKADSFSVSKIWLRGRKDKPNSGAVDSFRRALSCRFPVHGNVVAEPEMGGRGRRGGGARRAISEIDISRWETGGDDEEIQSCDSLDSQANAYQPSFAKRTMSWLRGTDNKVV